MKNKIKHFIKNELIGWKKSEIIWLFLSCTIIMALSVYWGDTVMGIISSVTGIAYSVLTGKGKLSGYFFGVINSTLYAIISYNATFYGETMLNALYYLPMQFVGFYVWSKNIDSDTHEVIKKRMSLKGRFGLILTIAVFTFAYGLLLEYLNDSMPFIDSFTTVSSVIAMIATIKMYTEQWWIWLAVNAVSVYMWWCDFRTGSDNMATLLMWAVYLVNAVIMIVKWEREILYSSENTGTQ